MPSLALPAAVVVLDVILFLVIYYVAELLAFLEPFQFHSEDDDAVEQQPVFLQLQSVLRA